MRMAKKLGRRIASRPRADGRRPLLVYLNPGVIKQLKKVALDEETTAYAITEAAVRTWLASHKVSHGRRKR